MKNILIIGNGFDLAHGMSTSYGDFINFVINSDKEECALAEVIEEKKYHHSRDHKLTINVDGLRIKSKNGFFRKICENFNQKKWCDIEQLYFEELQVTLKGDNGYIVDYLHREFNEVKIGLEYYLSTMELPDKLNCFKLFLEGSYIFHNSLVLNFNYTNTLKGLYNLEKFKFINIHGQLKDENHPIIFGYSATEDEMQMLMAKNNNEYLKNIKAFHYKRTTAEREINQFLNGSDGVRVFVIGHSCGISDGNVLHNIFSNKNIQSIYPFYHDNYDNYSDMIVNIKRVLKGSFNFDKVASFNESFRCPQIGDSDAVKSEFETKVNELIN